jgi:hypothetical protein
VASNDDDDAISATHQARAVQPFRVALLRDVRADVHRGVVKLDRRGHVHFCTS